ncbi:lipoprotein insertase outer membrane protein LolB [Bowmanella pacifica]|uniref:Outer-membrane lipoprotein LolB n=1 Tax=Bowmanella pacifica TaxID=502051 RepID=A0A917Z3T5_9ALTE|nr:lipoprotein insertase outer membrane protein LolB [Bowmanella pacifica]GGO74340.1 outer-membrane lipoprotein LolB [Bowmanella pacifica]
MPFNRLRLLGCLLIVALLNACATRPVVDYSVNARQHQQQLAQLQDWRINGKLAYKGEKERFSATLNWQQQDGDYSLGLSSFIGTRILTLQKSHQLISLEYEDRTYQHHDASALLYELTGWAIPVEQIPAWLKGQVLPDNQAIFSDNGLLQQIRTPQGWQVNLSDYRQTAHYILPYQLELKTPSDQIKIRVDKWQVN